MDGPGTGNLSPAIPTWRTGDVIMLAPNGDALLRAIGREPAAKGIIEPPAMAAAMAGIQQAVAADEATRADAEREAAARGETLPPREDGHC